MTPSKVLYRGETVDVPAKNPVTTFRWWGSVVAIFSWLLVIAVKRGWLPEEIRQPVQDLGLEVIAGVIGTLAALYGGWTASQPLGWKKEHVTKAVKCLPFLFVLALLAGCGTSASYKSLVAKDYPVIATRMDRYPLTDEERGEVQTLRDMAKDRNAVKYETARPAWEAVEPDYRRYVGEDANLREQRRTDWLKTADLLNEAQEAEAEHHRVLGGR